MTAARDCGLKNEKTIAEEFCGTINNAEVEKMIKRYAKWIQQKKEHESLKSQYSKNSQKKIIVANIIEMYKRTVAFNEKYLDRKMAYADGIDILQRVNEFSDNIVAIHDELIERRIHGLDAIRRVEEAVDKLDFNNKYVIHRKSKTDKKDNEDQDATELKKDSMKKIISAINDKLDNYIEEVRVMKDAGETSFEVTVRDKVEDLFQPTGLMQSTLDKISDYIVRTCKPGYPVVVDDLYLKLKKKFENVKRDLLIEIDDFKDIIMELCEYVKIEAENNIMPEKKESEEVFANQKRANITAFVDSLLKGIKENLRVYYNQNKGIEIALENLHKTKNYETLEETEDTLVSIKGILAKINVEYIKQFEEKSISKESRCQKKIEKTQTFLSDLGLKEELIKKGVKGTMDDCLDEWLNIFTSEILDDFCSKEYFKTMLGIRRREIAKIKKGYDGKRDNKYYISKLNPSITVMTYNFIGSNIDKYKDAVVLLDTEKIEKTYISNVTKSWNGKGNRLNVKGGTQKYYKGEYLFAESDKLTLMNRLYGNNELSMNKKESKAFADRFHRMGALYDYRSCMIQNSPDGKKQNYKKEYAKTDYITPENEADLVGGVEEVNKKSIIYLSTADDVITFFAEL